MIEVEGLSKRFGSRQAVDGLMLLTIALARSHGDDRWIADLHEAARSAATESEWYAAKARADEWLAANGQVASGS